MTYVPLHVHSHFSLLDGLSQPKQIAKRCKTIGVNACALTDHGSISGAVSFISALKKENIKPILGIELYVCDGNVKEKLNRNLTHLVLLAKNMAGWKDLLKIVSFSNHPDHFYYKPRIDLENLASLNSGNLIAFSGHMGSHIANLLFTDLRLAYNAASESEARTFINQETIKNAMEMAAKLRDIFGRDNFYLEVQLVDRVSPVTQLIGKGIRYIGSQLNIPCIATPDAHYPAREDADDQRVLLCTNMKTTFREIRSKMVNDEDIGLGGFFRSNDYHIPSIEEMQEYHKGHEEELENTVKLAESCESYDITSKPRLPKFDCPDGLSSEEYLKRLCEEGWTQRLPIIKKNAARKGITEDVYRERLSEELKILNEAGLADYFLIVRDIIRYAESEGQLTGPGRGSAASSLVLYLLGATQVEPVFYDLLFSRFYNASRNIPNYVSFDEKPFLKSIGV